MAFSFKRSLSLNTPEIARRSPQPCSLVGPQSRKRGLLSKRCQDQHRDDLGHKIEGQRLAHHHPWIAQRKLRVICRDPEGYASCKQTPCLRAVRLWIGPVDEIITYRRQIDVICLAILKLLADRSSEKAGQHNHLKAEVVAHGIV